MTGSGSTDGPPTHPEALTRLARSERGLRQMVDGISDATLLIDWGGDVVLANSAAEALLGRPAQELVGTHIERLLAPSARAAHRARREALAADPPTGPVAVLEGISVLTREGAEVPVRVSLVGVETADGPRMCATIRDISADLRERQDAALRRIAGTAGPDQPLGRLLPMVGEEAAALLGVEKALVARFDPDASVVVVGSHGGHRTAVGDRIPPGSGSSLITVSRTGAAALLAYDDLPEGDPVRTLALSQGYHRAVAVPITVHGSLWGGLMVATANAMPTGAVDALTRFAEYAGAMIGAAESREVERALRDSEERFRLLADFIPQLLWTAGPDGECDFVNQRWREYTGAPAEDHLGMGWLECVHPGDRDDLTRVWRTALADRAPFAAEFRIRRHDGAYRRFDARGVPMRDRTGEVVRWFGSNTDVEEARAGAQSVRASEAQLRAALDAGRMGAWTFDAASGAVTIDANIRALFELDPGLPESAVRETLRSRIHPDDLARVSASFEEALGGGTQAHHVEHRILLRDGGTRWVEIRGRIARDDAGAPSMVTGVMVDITEARREGERLLRSQKLEALGTLAGGIAHDFNNLLQVVGGNVSIARTEIPEDHDAQEHLAIVERATQRAADLVGRILAYSRPDEDSPRASLALDELVEDALDLLRPTLPAMIEVRCRFDDDLPRVSADSASITQVVTNLVTNAAQAIGRRAGTIEFRIDTVELEAEEMRDAPGLSPGEYLRLTVSDDGPGMDPAILMRAFDPFFTTKDPGLGTGLGLSIVHSVMRAHGGTVAAYSEPGVGTAFRLYFPIDRAGQATDPVVPAAAPPPGRAGRILFVDDEPDLVALHERSLGRAGHEVTGHTDPRLALERFRADPDGFDAVVTDLSMPGMTGLELAREILALRPGIPVLIASGHIPPDERAEAEALGVRDILPKPSPIARLRDALSEALRD